jgi:hypothetical protein
LFNHYGKFWLQTGCRCSDGPIGDPIFGCAGCGAYRRKPCSAGAAIGPTAFKEAGRGRADRLDPKDRPNRLVEDATSLGFGAAGVPGGMGL